MKNKLAQFILDDAVTTVCKKVDLSEVKGKRILITGASGMVGLYLLACLKFLSEQFPNSFETIAVVHSEPAEYLKELLDYNGGRFIQGDLTDYNFCVSLPKADYIIHAAGYAQPGRFMKNPDKTFKINTCTTANLLENLNKNGKFLFISSSEVYSGLSGGAFQESQIGNSNTTHPRSCYIEGKRGGEAICIAHRGLGVEAKSVRLSLAYGPGTKKGDKRVMPMFIEKGMQGEIDLLDRGEAIRNYCYVTDAVEMMWYVLFNGKESIYNIGGFSKVTIADLANKISKQLKARVKFPVDSGGALTGSPTDVSLDMTKVEKEFNKKRESYINFDEGLNKTIEWYRELYNLDKD